MQLPLEALAAHGELVHLPRDQLVEIDPLEPARFAVTDEALTRHTKKCNSGPSRSTQRPLGKGSGTRSRT